MRPVHKYILRNVASKPLRTIVICICFAAVALTFSLCLTVTLTAGKTIENQMRKSTGKTDITLYNRDGFTEKSINFPDSCEILSFLETSVEMQQHSIENFKYVNQKTLKILGADCEKSAAFELLPECHNVNENEIVISSAVSKKLGYKMGDTVLIPCCNGNTLSLVIKEILPCEKYFSVFPMSAIVTPENAAVIAEKAQNLRNVAYINVYDDSKIPEVSEKIAVSYPDASVQQIMGTDEVNSILSGISMTFYVIFMIVFMMIIFITSAFSKSIFTERLSSIGTLRSIGANIYTVTKTLLAESFLYGMFGGLTGAVIFFLIKDTVICNFVKTSLFDNTHYNTPLYIPVAALFLSVALSCGCSLFSVIKTAKMPLRDMIFMTKDTLYATSISGTIIGVFLISATVVMHVQTHNSIISSIAMLVCFVTGICLILPSFLSIISQIAACFRRGFPVLRLSIIGAGTKKTSVNSTVLCVVVLTLTVMIFVLSCSVKNLYGAEIYNSDIIISDLSQKSEYYKNIVNSDKTTASEFLYKTDDSVILNGQKTEISVFGYDSFEFFSGINGFTGYIGESEIVIDKDLMKRYRIQSGEKITLTLKSDQLRPELLTLTVLDQCDSVYYDMHCNAILINKYTYKRIYHDYPYALLINSTDTDYFKSNITDSEASFITSEQYRKELDGEQNSVTTILDVLIFLGLSLAVISTAGNSTVAFEQRKREFAVLHGVGMSNARLIQLIITESVFSAVMSAMISILSGIVAINILSEVLSAIDISIPLFYDKNNLILFIMATLSLLTLTAIKPVLSLVKMNTSEQLKQE